MSADPHDLDRFVTAQSEVYQNALAELQAGLKRSHWMWFIFPQLAGLGQSPTSQHFAIATAAEARAYLAHPLLGGRLVECCNALLALDGRSANAIFGNPDDLKLRSSMTLFASACPQKGVFQRVLDAYFRGAADQRTINLLKLK